jgi:predicted nucleotide-binding protein (sugar kinase/HSP70/actin superfamily)
MDFDVEIFKGKSFSDLMKDIYSNSSKKDRQINMMIGELRPLIKNVGDATVIVPLIKEYLEVGVKNDEHLVKLAAVVQRLVSTSNRVQAETGNSWMLSEEEKKQLMGELDEIVGTEKTINEKVVELSTQQTQIESEINDIQDGLI